MLFALTRGSKPVVQLSKTQTHPHTPITHFSSNFPSIYKKSKSCYCICYAKGEANMGLRALPLSSSHNGFPPSLGVAQNLSKRGLNRSSKFRTVSAKSEEKDKKEPKKSKQSLFGSVTEALDFSQVRSEEDALLLDEAREATGSGGRMTREQYGALRRKIGGTYKDFFKSYVDVDGQYVEEGWVDKTCKVCKKDTKGEPRQLDRLGRYVHVSCLEKSNSGNFFTRLFSF